MTTYNTGNPVGSSDPRDLYDNAENLDTAVNSEGTTFNDRTGKSRLTLKGMEQVFDGGQPAINAYYNALSEADRSESEADRSAAEANRAESARDAAQLSSGIYADTSSGVAATASGDYFSVPSGSYDEYLILYLNNAGTAQEVSRYPSASALQSVETGLSAAQQTIEKLEFGANSHYIGDDGNAYRRLDYFASSSSDFLFEFGDKSVPVADVVTLREAQAGEKILGAMPKSASAVSFAELPQADQWVQLDVTVSVDVATDHTGAADADKVIANTNNTKHRIYLSETKESGKLFLVEAILKPDGVDKVRVSFNNIQYVDVNLSTLAVIDESPQTYVFEIGASGNGYVRVVLGCIAIADSELTSIYLLDSAGNLSYAGDGVSGVLVSSLRSRIGPDLQLVQLDTSTAPTLVDSGRAKGLSFDGQSQRILTPAKIEFFNPEKLTVLMALRQKSATSVGVLVNFGDSPFSGVGLEVLANNAENGAIGAGYGEGVSDYLMANAPAVVDPEYAVVSMVLDPAGATPDDQLRIRVNGSDTNETQPSSAGAPTNLSFTAQDYLAIGGRTASQYLASFDLFGLAIITRDLSPSDLQAAEKSLGYKVGKVLSESAAPLPTDSLEVVPVSYSDSRGNEPGQRPSAFSTLDIQTDATDLTLYAYNNLYNIFPAYTEIGVYVNGAYNQTIRPSSEGSTTHAVTLPLGNKVVSFVNGMQSRPDPLGIVRGVWVEEVTSPSSKVRQTFPEIRTRTLVYGDSISVGGNAADVPADAWVLKLRQDAHPMSVALEGWGYRSLHEDAETAAQLTQFARTLAQYSPAKIWLAIGTNDYGLDKWSSADFGQAYADLLDRLSLLLPGVRIYCQTPLVRSDESANLFGNTLGDYRSAISTAVSSRTDFCVLIDGASILLTSDLADGVHPTTAGHSKYADFVAAQLLG